MKRKVIFYLVLYLSDVIEPENTIKALLILNITLFNSIWVAVLFVDSFHFGLREKLLSLELSEIIGTYLKFTMLKVLFQK